MLPAQVSYWTLEENKRHNLATEDLTAQDISEKKRHNIVTEQLGYDELSEKIRHNKETEGVSWSSLSETIRHNQVVEALSNESNAIGWAQASASQSQAAAALENAMTNRRRMLNDYSIDLTRNQISQQEADTHAYTAEQGAAQGWMSSTATQSNATTNRRQAQVAEDKLAIDQYLAPSEVARNYSQTYKNVMDGSENIFKFVGGIVGGIVK